LIVSKERTAVTNLTSLYVLPLQSGVAHTQLIVWPVKEDKLDTLRTAAAVFTGVVDKILYARKRSDETVQLQFTHKEILIQVRIVRTKNLSSALPSLPFHKTLLES
jgi:hypothetical protein